MTASPRRVLVTGASGYLGSAIVRAAAGRFELWCASRKPAPSPRSVALDIRDDGAVAAAIAGIRPHAIVHAAALASGDDEPALMAINVGGSRNVARAARAVGARLVHISTDVVHAGDAAPYADATAPTPVNAYGRSKAAAEAAVAAEHDRAAIVRTSLIYGLDAMDRGTAGFARRLQQGEVVRLFSDSLRQPILDDALAAALLRLIDTRWSGPINIAGDEALSREAFGRRMLAWWNIVAPGRIEAVRAAALSAAIPLDLRLDIRRAQSLLDLPLAGVGATLRAARARG